VTSPGWRRDRAGRVLLVVARTTTRASGDGGKDRNKTDELAACSPCSPRFPVPSSGPQLPVPVRQACSTMPSGRAVSGHTTAFAQSSHRTKSGR